uniref:Schlafen AlbA-2 domain-containing protein n=1 Tax=Candidatus Methanogaster sp. ANME-2c ERB4 TaxID=2759911 RepID=A0A7G9YGV6_9EURY|nr:hypothetical protein ADAEDOLL_00002 [Methanosarcinales archaeon ANME-2c ERB4]QNO47240.1 hypothetical protein OPBKKODO_00002 [Methanosarcinales archaeon ANME-2c ERB4]
MEEMDLILDEGEGYLIEFKESMSDSLAKEMVAFANSSGGRIFLGVSDEGMVKGVNITNRLRSQVQDIARKCDPPVSILLKGQANVLTIAGTVWKSSDFRQWSVGCTTTQKT